MARLQEEGRFAVTRLKDDLRMANAQYCTDSGGDGAGCHGVAGAYLDGLRAPNIYARSPERLRALET